MAHLLGKNKDYEHPDALADAILHPKDRAFSVPQIYTWLDRCGMSFGRWIEQAPYLPQGGVLARTPHSAVLNELPESAQHAAVELFRGTITQHKFVAYRSDRTQGKHPIQFSGEQWPTCVPIRLPWTVCDRDGVPAGAVAVLLNQAHKHPDLVLKINAAQLRLFNEIDGRSARLRCIQGRMRLGCWSSSIGSGSTIRLCSMRRAGENHSVVCGTLPYKWRTLPNVATCSQQPDFGPRGDFTPS